MAINTDFRVKNGLYVGENINALRGSVSAETYYGKLFNISSSGALGSGSTDPISGQNTLNFEAVSGIKVAVSDNNLQFSLSLSNSFEIDSNDIDLSDTGVSAGTYGSQTTIPTFIVDAQGRLTSAAEVTVATTLSTEAGTGAGTVDLLSERLRLLGTSNEITTVASNNTVTIGLPDDVTIGNDLNVTGNFTVNGSTVTQNVTSVLIEDPVIKLANGNTSTDIKDIGFYGEYADSGTKYTGLIRDVTFAGGNKPYVFFEGVTTDILSDNDSGSGKPTVANFADVYMGRIGVNTDIYNATTRVEINLDNGENIHFDGDGDLFVDIDRNSSVDAGRLRYQTNGTDEFEVGFIGGTAGYHITDGSTNSLFTVLSNGNIGIGTVTPGSALEIVGDLTFSGASRDILIPDNLGSALEIKQSTDLYQRFITTNGSEKIEFHKDISIGNNLTVTGTISSASIIYADAFESKAGGSTIVFNDNVDIDGLLTVSSTISGNNSLFIDGSTTLRGAVDLGNASGDIININGQTVNLPNIAAGTDDTVVIYNGSSLVTDEIDSRVWGNTLIDNNNASGTADRLTKWIDSNTIADSQIADTSSIVTIGVSQTNPLVIEPTSTSTSVKFANNTSGYHSTCTSVTQSSSAIVLSFPHANYRSGKVVVQSEVNSAQYEVAELLVIHDGSTAHQTEYGNISTGSSLCVTYTTRVNGTNLEVIASNACGSGSAIVTTSVTQLTNT
jgi:hypothetical protein